MAIESWQELRAPNNLSWQAVLILTAALVVYCICWVGRAVYRLYFHPLAKFPGSKLAAVSTEWFEWYWNIHQPGQLLFEIERLHARYGPVVRIGVNDVHCNDPQFYLDCTNLTSTYIKDPAFYKTIGFPHSILGMVDIEKHRVRKQVLAPAFSSTYIQKVSHRIQAKVQDMCRKFERFSTEDQPISIYSACKAYALDVIAELTIGKDWGALQTPDFHHPQLEVMKECLKGAWMARAFPVLSKIAFSLPAWFVQLYMELPMVELGMNAISGLDDYLDDRKKGVLQNITMTPVPRDVLRDAEKAPRVTSQVIERLLDVESAKGYKPLIRDHINEEILVFLGAGNDTTSTSMISGMWEILNNSTIQKKLHAELDAAFPDPDMIEYAKAKQLPYLTAVVRETMRFSTPIPGRIPRLVPKGGTTIQGLHVPEDSAIHFSPHILNRLASIWGADADSFLPERWLDIDQATSVHMEKHMSTFGRGTRQCLGLHLATCEVYLFYANLFRRFHVKIYNTTKEDMRWTDQSFKVYWGKEFEVKMTPR